MAPTRGNRGAGLHSRSDGSDAVVALPGGSSLPPLSGLLDETPVDAELWTQVVLPAVTWLYGWVEWQVNDKRRELPSVVEREHRLAFTLATDRVAEAIRTQPDRLAACIWRAMVALLSHFVSRVDPLLGQLARVQQELAYTRMHLEEMLASRGLASREGGRDGGRHGQHGGGNGGEGGGGLNADEEPSHTSSCGHSGGHEHGGRSRSPRTSGELLTEEMQLQLQRQQSSAPLGEGGVPPRRPSHAQPHPPSSRRGSSSSRRGSTSSTSGRRLSGEGGREDAEAFFPGASSHADEVGELDELRDRVMALQKELMAERSAKAAAELRLSTQREEQVREAGRKGRGVQFEASGDGEGSPPQIAKRGSRGPEGRMLTRKSTLGSIEDSLVERLEEVHRWSELHLISA